jgi:hypothetical protein
MLYDNTAGMSRLKIEVGYLHGQYHDNLKCQKAVAIVVHHI